MNPYSWNNYAHLIILCLPKDRELLRVRQRRNAETSLMYDLFFLF